MKKLAPRFGREREKKDEEEFRPWVYRLPGLEAARQEWVKRMGQDFK